MAKVNKALIDRMAELEVAALLDGLNDEEMRKNPSFLEKVRKFLSQNDLVTTPETPGVAAIKKLNTEIPVFEDTKVN